MSRQPGGPLIAVGRITRAHGVRGEVKVLVLSEVEDRFSEGSRLALEDGRTLTVEGVRRTGVGALVRFAEVPDRTAAESLGGAYLFVGEGDLPDLPEGSWWPHQIEGCEIVTEDGRSLGRVAEVVRTPANDIWVARTGDDETLVPALRDVVLAVDLPARRITVRSVPGLTEPER
ncbi:MAG: 16S rRNA processing protein RimM [Actinobacteria bacterium]|nr:16S rRNA processing protein RimM [Actinomycetota bacterium]